jgi:hypothetical protein
VRRLVRGGIPGCGIGLRICEKTCENTRERCCVQGCGIGLRICETM